MDDYLVTDNVSDSAVAVNDSKDRVLLALEQLLGQCDDDDALPLRIPVPVSVCTAARVHVRAERAGRVRGLMYTYSTRDGRMYVSMDVWWT